MYLSFIDVVVRMIKSFTNYYIPHMNYIYFLLITLTYISIHTLPTLYGKF